MATTYDLSKFTQPNLQYVDLVLVNTARGEILPDALMWERPRLLKKILFSCTAFTDNAAATQANECLLPAVVIRWWRRWREQASGALLPPHVILDNAPFTPADQAWVSAAVLYPRPLRWIFPNPITIPNRDTMFIDWVNPAVVQAFGGMNGGNIWFAVHGYGRESGRHLVLSDVCAFGATPGGGAAGTAGTQAPGANARNDFGEDMIATRLVCLEDTLNTVYANSELLNHLRIGIRFEPSGLVLSTRQQADFPPLLFWGADRAAGDRLCVLEPQGEPIVLHDRETLGFDIQNNSGALGLARTLRMQVGLVSLVEPVNGVQ